jgi:hypothetical protein
MRANIFKSSPAFAWSIPPQHQILLKEGEALGTGLVKIAQIGDGPPLFTPAGVHGCFTTHVMIVRS